MNKILLESYWCPFPWRSIEFRISDWNYDFGPPAKKGGQVFWFQYNERICNRLYYIGSNGFYITGENNE